MNDVTTAKTGKEKNKIKFGKSWKPNKNSTANASEEQIITAHYSTYPNKNGCKMKF